MNVKFLLIIIAMTAATSSMYSYSKKNSVIIQYTDPCSASPVPVGCPCLDDTGQEDNSMCKTGNCYGGVCELCEKTCTACQNDGQCCSGNCDNGFCDSQLCSYGYSLGTIAGKIAAKKAYYSWDADDSITWLYDNGYIDEATAQLWGEMVTECQEALAYIDEVYQYVLDTITGNLDDIIEEIGDEAEDLDVADQGANASVIATGVDAAGPGTITEGGVTTAVDITVDAATKKFVSEGA